MGTGTSVRYLPIRKLAVILGEEKCNNILKAHIAIGLANWEERAKRCPGYICLLILVIAN